MLDRPDRAGRRRPFSTWVKKLTNFKSSSSSDGGGVRLPSSKRQQAKLHAKLRASKNNNPYPQSGRVGSASHADVDVETSSYSFSTALSGSATSIERSSRMSSDDGRAPPTTGARSMAPTISTDHDGAPSVVAPSHGAPSVAGTSRTIGGVESPTANNLLTDNASIITLASSSQRRRRRSLDTDASVRALAPSSLWGGSRESLPLSVLSANIDQGAGMPTTPGLHQSSSRIANAERTSIYSATGVAPAIPGERNSFYAKQSGTGDGASIRSGLLGHGRADSISGSIGGVTSPLTSPREASEMDDSEDRGEGPSRAKNDEER
ncbi:uncharacterized protein ColSpa_04639 [Colletotrichum spaethianum]|uniref:Uncharacterized protein n=1 Tax=Colletotrichum spaethianum TaxID=700344 RepID=A0AA37L9S8_9PEZI|nr:uncharacterized protein ColSpa_04639 [Colletotrichum spaethianum]GKT44458.1 hypothetical protein ColSpa_04639 [Colletotrichum spaethianum]